jgi:AcrR family transcriptional regulator
MAVQARSQATRQKIINAAVDLFGEVGYASAGFGDIIERVEMTKGALYHHFDSKEALASAIIDEGSARLLTAFRVINESSAPAMENLIHGVFAVADILTKDKVARVGRQLSRALGEFNETVASVYRGWLTVMAAQARRAAAEGDLRADLDPDMVAEFIQSAMLGVEFITGAGSDFGDLGIRVTRTWEILLPAIISDESLPYFREFLARESLRHRRSTLSMD